MLLGLEAGGGHHDDGCIGGDCDVGRVVVMILCGGTSGVIFEWAYGGYSL